MAVPARYERHPAQHFDAAVRAQLRPSIAILDVGSGRRPAIEPSARPAGCTYAGLDVSGRELALAPAGSYGEHVVADVTVPVAKLHGRFDLVVSWQVLEHVGDTGCALANMRGYLRPGGHLVALLSGRFSAFGVLNAAIPARLAVVLMRRLLQRDPQSVFPARYDRCHATGLRRLLAPWTRAEVVPIYQGAAYFNFALPLRAAYLAYENWAWRSGRANLATHYLLVAER